MISLLSLNFVASAECIVRIIVPCVSFSVGNFEAFRPPGATRCTDGGEILHGSDYMGSLPNAKFHPHRYNNRGIESPKTKKYIMWVNAQRDGRPVEYNVSPSCQRRKV